MKKKIAILLATIMTATMVPVTSAFADSSNSVSSVVTVKDGDFNDEVFLRIQPSGEIDPRGNGDATITISLQNAEFDEDDMDAYFTSNATIEYPSNQSRGLDRYQFAAFNDESTGTTHTFDDLLGEYTFVLRNTPNATAESAFNAVMMQYIGTGLISQSADLPYKLKRNGKKELEVTLFPLPYALAGETFNRTNKPAYKIPIPFTADGTGDVTISIDSNGTSIRGGVSYTIASSANKSGDTVTTIDDIKVGSDDLQLEPITIKETVYGTFEPGKKVSLKANSGFEIKNPTTQQPVIISSGINANFPELVLTNGKGSVVIESYTDEKGNAAYRWRPAVTGDNANDIVEYEFKDNSFDFTLPKIDLSNTNVKDEDKYTSKKPAAIKIENLWISPEDDDNYGEVKLTVSGSSAGVSKETILVGERGDYGFTMRAIEDPTTIYSGRKGYGGVRGQASTNYKDYENYDYDDDGDYGSYISEDAFKEYDIDDYESATLEFAEITADTWNTNRKLKFTVPDEVKIYDWEIDEQEDCSIKDDYVSIKNDGHTLEIDLSNDENAVDKDEASKFELKLNLSVDANFEGDIPVSVEGAGMSSGDVEDVVIARAVKPVTLETSSTKTNMGYQKVDTADITLTEAEGGMLVKNGKVEIAIDSVYGEDELGFADENIDYEIEGDLKIKTFKVSKGVISFIVDSSSVDASKITIKNVKIGTTRSIPWGSYGLKVSGSALINNYSEELVDEGCETSGTTNIDPGVGFFDDNEAIKFANYIEVITETGTLDKVVKVTIGEKTIVVDGQNYEMDVEPYIQAESSSTMVPLRFVMVALGVDSDNVGSFDESNKVSFDATTKTATIFYAAGTNMTTIQFTAGSNTMMVNGAAIPMENGVKAEIKDGRMFVPFRAIGTAINVKVGWDAETRTATYNG